MWNVLRELDVCNEREVGNETIEFIEKENSKKKEKKWRKRYGVLRSETNRCGGLDSARKPCSCRVWFPIESCWPPQRRLTATARNNKKQVGRKPSTKIETREKSCRFFSLLFMSITSRRWRSRRSLLLHAVHFLSPSFSCSCSLLQLPDEGNHLPARRYVSISSCLPLERYVLLAFDRILFERCFRTSQVKVSLPEVEELWKEMSATFCALRCRSPDFPFPLTPFGSLGVVSRTFPTFMALFPYCIHIADVPFHTTQKEV